IYEKSDLLAPLLPGMIAPPHERLLGDDEKTYFLGLPTSDQPDDRAGDVSDAVPVKVNQGWRAQRKRRKQQAAQGERS
ncbi:MAG TPA: NADH-quinone oxidoreductase subunit I, partial [Propionibacteriaceae bacterium]|nr:NADH-quinone oxidoreductase subunit I [Propionibacteriaceae bacterium]